MPKERKPVGVKLAQEPVAFKPRPQTLRDIVRRLAANTDNIAWSAHALERMAERGITDKMAIEVLQKGDCEGEVEAGANPGEWKLKMVRQMKGKREAGVVVLTAGNARLLVKTVEWEDI